MTIKEILNYLKGIKSEYEFSGDDSVIINGFSSLANYKKNTITWVKNAKNISADMSKKIGCAVVQKGVNTDIVNRIISKDSKQVFFSILEHFWSDNQTKIMPGIGEGSYVSDSVVLDDSVRIGRNCYIEGDIHIGKNTVIENNVTIINKVKIGENCIIRTGAMLGKDGEGYAFDSKNIPKRIMHFGGIYLGNRVEIGVNSCINRGTIDDTVISDDTKIASLVVIGHNVMVGKGVIILDGVVICGSAEVGDRCYIAPGVIVKNHVKLSNDVFAGLNTVIGKSIEEKTMIYDMPPKDVKIPNYRNLL